MARQHIDGFRWWRSLKHKHLTPRYTYHSMAQNGFVWFSRSTIGQLVNTEPFSAKSSWVGTATGQVPFFSMKCNNVLPIDRTGTACQSLSWIHFSSYWSERKKVDEIFSFRWQCSHLRSKVLSRSCWKVLSRDFLQFTCWSNFWTKCSCLIMFTQIMLNC